MGLRFDDRCCGLGAALFLALFAHVASAALPPAISSATVPIQIPEGGEQVIVNLRELGVLSGSAPLIIDPQTIQLLLNGESTGVLSARVFAGSTPGAVCVVIENSDYTPPIEVPDSFALEISVSSLSTRTPTVGSVLFVDAPGPVVDEGEEGACSDPNTRPIADAGQDRTIQDVGAPGETIVLDGSASSDSDPGTVLTYQWSGEGTEFSASTSPAVTTAAFSPGTYTFTLNVMDDSGDIDTAESEGSSVTITIVAVEPPAQAPIANAGADQSIADSDQEPGELVTLDGSASSDPEGQPLSYAWALQGETTTVLGNDATLSVRLPDGANTVMLRVEDPDGNFTTDTVVVTVAAARERVALAELPNLSPNKRQVALALDRVCLELDALSGSETALSADQQVLLERCNGLYFDNTAANQSQALGELGGEDFAAARTQTLLFSNTLYASVMDRLVALRGGARGLSLAGLNIVVDGKLVPLAQVQEMFKGLLGGGASSDADEAGGLLADKLGIWARGNYSFGEKDVSAASPRFEADQWSLIGGVDYRISTNSVVGGSFAYGQSGIEFDPAGEGALDTTSWAASVYGSIYAAENFYFDAIANLASSDYDARRNITYADGSGLIDVDADGSTDGMTISGGLSMGYDFLLGGFTLSPTLGAFYIDATIDGFTEHGADGLNLIYDEQTFTSLTGNLGVRATYAWNTSWGVLLPHVRVDYVREFEDEVDVFGVRFAADPNATSTPPILVETDNPDRSYWRLATGFSAQFAHGFSGYVEYQRLESFEYISFEDLSIGLRMQKSF